MQQPSQRPTRVTRDHFSLPIKNIHDEKYYKERKPQPEYGATENFLRFIWDKDRRSVLGRTAQEWGDFGLLYLCFYSALFSFMALQMWIAYKYATAHDKPIFQYDKRSSQSAPTPARVKRLASLGTRGPGIGMKPNIIPYADPAMILIDENDEYGQLTDYITAINETLSEYKVDKTMYDVNCKNVSPRNTSLKPCLFDITTLDQCSREPYGYTSTNPQPCIYIKFNKRFYWRPDPFNQASILPDDMPEWLQRFIRNTDDKFNVWLSCGPQNDEDTPFVGELEYLPGPGFPIQFFPFTGQDGYLQPMIALHFKNITVNQLVNIECKTWAHNIDNENRYNMIFQIMIKDS